MSVQTNSTVCPQVPAAEVASKSGLVLVDVRSPIEYETEHIAGAINLPLETLESRCEEVPRGGQLVVICRSGKRAERGAYALLGRGFQPKVMEGGMIAWRKAGLPIKEGKKRLPIERQIQLIVGSGVLTGVLLGVFVNPGSWLFLDSSALGLLLLDCPEPVRWVFCSAKHRGTSWKFPLLHLEPAIQAVAPERG